MSHCQARQCIDQMICGPCALAWDVGDPEPPRCGQIRQPEAPAVRRVTEARRAGNAEVALKYAIARFERWAIKEGYSLAKSEDGFMSEPTRNAWHGFRAALEMP